MSDDLGNQEFSSAPTFDREKLMEQVGDDEEFLQMILDVFLDDVPNQFEILRGALAAQDATLVAEKGHSIKGASGTAAALAMQSTSQEIEMAGKSKDLQKVQILFERLEAEFERFKAETAV